jgi:hypothetical protein
MTTTESKTQWQYLEKRPHPWREQLYLKGRKLKAFTLWMNMTVNKMTPSEVAENWDLPLGAVKEVIEYCESHQGLLKREAQEERRRLDRDHDREHRDRQDEGKGCARHGKLRIVDHLNGLSIRPVGCGD